MSSTNPPDNTKKPEPVAGNAAAEQFLAEEVQAARGSLKRTKITTIVLLLVVGGYMGTITVMLGKFLEPKEAAMMATSQISIQVETHATTMADSLKDKIPALIAEAPQYVLDNLPGWREQIEDSLASQFETFCSEKVDELSTHLTEFIRVHKDEIKEMLEASEKPDAFRELGPELQQEILDYLAMKDEEPGSESIREKIDKSMIALKDVEKHMHRLATANDLTPTEKKARRAIAIISKNIELKTITAE